MRARGLWMVLTVALLALSLTPDLSGQQQGATNPQRQGGAGGQRQGGAGGRGAGGGDAAPAGPLDPVAIAAAAAKAVNPAELEYGPAKGTLIIIGGGSTNGTGIMERFIEMAGGAENGKFVVFPTNGGNRDRDGNLIN